MARCSELLAVTGGINNKSSREVFGADSWVVFANTARGCALEPGIFLTADELAVLTGYRLPAHQVRWLREKGWRFEVNGNRRPIVARKYAEKMLGCGTAEFESYKPNFSALHEG